MKKYVEITLLPDVDITLYFLWEKLYQQLHLAFVENQKANGKVTVGVSFPKYNLEKRSIGNKLRIFSKATDELESLNLQKWLSRLSDYIHITSIRSTPENVSGYAFFRRLNDKSNLGKLAQRRADKLSITYEEALNYFQDRQDRKQPEHNADQYPFISMRSLGSGKKYPITIIKKPTDTPIEHNGFSTYGLSSKSSVPLF